jgi:hypothetical protein
MIDAVNENPTIEEQTAHYQRDDLVTRLRKHSHGGMHPIGNEAADEIERLREALASCVPVVEAVMEDHGWLGDHEGIEGALEATGLIAWNVVPPSGEIHTHFEGWEDLEPGDSFWTATKKWGAVWALAKRLPETAK